jgi:hypothetical protein
MLRPLADLVLLLDSLLAAALHCRLWDLWDEVHCGRWLGRHWPAGAGRLPQFAKAAILTALEGANAL